MSSPTLIFPTNCPTTNSAVLSQICDSGKASFTSFRSLLTHAIALVCVNLLGYVPPASSQDMTLVLGIDPGSRVTGFGVIRVTGTRQEYVGSGCIRTAEKAALPAKLEEIFSGVMQIIDEYTPNEVAIEKIFMSRSAESALKLGQARGVAIVAAVNRQLPVYEYEARKIKQAVVGTGAATKPQVQHMIQALLKLPGRPQQDAADALAIAMCHINTQQNLARMAGGATSFRRGRLVKGDRP